MDTQKLHKIVVKAINKVGIDAFKSTSLFASNERKQQVNKLAA